jgi:hypothetical protein
MKILIISHAYHPTVSPRAIRWTHIAEEWVRKGHEVDVVAAWQPGLAGAEELNGVGIRRVGKAMSELWRDRFKETNKRPVPSEDQISPRKQTYFVKNLKKTSVALLMWIRRHTWKKLWWPDSSCLWYFPARKKAGQLSLRKKYDTLISVSLPFTGHLVALHLQKKVPASRWIADSGDPFCFLDKPEANNRTLYSKKNYSVEKKVFDCADAITVTTRETSQCYANIFPEYQNKIHVIPPLLASSTATETEGTLSTGKAAIRLVYIGRLYRENRNPDFLLALFHRLLASDRSDPLELHFFGSINDCRDVIEPYKALYNNKIYLHGSVSHTTALRAMGEADILVNIGNANPHQLPSKVVEYAATGKPILNVAIKSTDSSASFFLNYPLCLSLYRESDEVTKAQIDSILDFIEKRRTLPSAELEKFLAPYRANQVAQSYEDIISA